jgi:hypothetical protein
MNKLLYPGTGKVVTFLPLLLSLSLVAAAQVRYTGNSISLVVSGTSTLHDWDMKSVKADCSATFQFASSGQISGISEVSFSTPVVALKSDHTAMDNNAYKALKTDKNPAITFTLTSVRVMPGTNGNSTVVCSGRLTIAGSTRDQEITATCKPNPDNTITVTGSEKISMQDFKISPPTFMLGTIKTGNDIVVTFNLTLRKA